MTAMASESTTIVIRLEMLKELIAFGPIAMAQSFFWQGC